MGSTLFHQTVESILPQPNAPLPSTLVDSAPLSKLKLGMSRSAQPIAWPGDFTPRTLNFYFKTFNVTVFEVALPFFGVTVTVTLHVPALTPLSVVPDTLQYFA